MVSLLEFSLRAALLALSFYGYLQFLRKQIRVELALSVLFSGIGSVMFLAGLFNMLQETTLVIFASGLYLTCRSVRKKESPLKLLTPGTCFFLIGCVVLLYLLYGVKFDIYDDFSHWATAAKAVAQFDRFPNASNTDVTYTSYPLGSAVFIYYITKILGISSEWIQCYAQNVLTLSMIVSLFAFASGVYGVLLAAVVSVFMVVSNTSLNTLCVDTLLTMITAAAFSFCLYYREELPSKLWYLLPYTVFLLAVKNSGTLFVVFLYAYLAYCFRGSKTDLWTLLAHMLLTFAVLYFWQKHVKQVYDSGMMSRHSLSLSYCASVFGEKNREEVLYIIRSFAEETFSLSNRMVYLAAIGFPLLLAAASLMKLDTSLIRRIYVFAVVFYCVYQIGLLGMYLFNMPPTTERLPSYARYHDMMVDLAAGLFCLCVLWTMSQCPAEGKPRILQVLTAVAGGVVLFCVINPYTAYFTRYTQPGADRQKIDALIGEYDIQKDRSYFILVSDERQDGGYLEYLAQYLLEPRDLQVCSPASMEGWLEYHCLKHYDYFILFEQTPETAGFFEETFQTSEPVLYTPKW